MTVPKTTETRCRMAVTMQDRTYKDHPSLHLFYPRYSSVGYDMDYWEEDCTKKDVEMGLLV